MKYELLLLFFFIFGCVYEDSNINTASNLDTIPIRELVKNSEYYYINNISFSAYGTVNYYDYRDLYSYTSNSSNPLRLNSEDGFYILLDVDTCLEKNREYPPQKEFLANGYFVKAYKFINNEENYVVLCNNPID